MVWVGVIMINFVYETCSASTRSNTNKYDTHLGVFIRNMNDRWHCIPAENSLRHLFIKEIAFHSCFLFSFFFFWINFNFTHLQGSKLNNLLIFRLIKAPNLNVSRILIPFQILYIQKATIQIDLLNHLYLTRTACVVVAGVVAIGHHNLDSCRINDYNFCEN